MMTRTLIIDDEPLARTIVRGYLKHHPGIEVVAECSDGFEGIKAITTYNPDLIFLDVQMPKISGFEMLELIETPVDVIFTTAFDEYAVKAFESNAVDYLLKPFDQARFDQAVRRWAERRAMPEKSKPSLAPLLKQGTQHPDEALRVVVRAGNTIKIIPAREILYLEAFDDYVKIHTVAGFHIKKKTMNYFEEVLSKSDFLRVHRSFIISLSELNRIEPMEKESHLAILTNGAKVPVSKSGYLRLKEKLKI